MTMAAMNTTTDTLGASSFLPFVSVAFLVSFVAKASR